MSAATGRMSGKVVLVTGAGSGIGRETAVRFADEGGVVIAADIDLDAARETARRSGGAALELDVTSSPGVESALRVLADDFEGLDVVVNNAGIVGRGAAHELEEAAWDVTLSTNLKSVYLVSRAAWPLLIARGGGVILNTASVAGMWGIPDNAAYCVSKAGVVMLTKCLALDGARAGIRVNCVCPGYTETALSDRWFEAQSDPGLAREAEAARHPLGRLGQPVDVADAFVYLASDSASWVTGTALVVDGGLTVGIWPP